jgi:hypothetical protein
MARAAFELPRDADELRLLTSVIRLLDGEYGSGHCIALQVRV